MKIIAEKYIEKSLYYIYGPNKEMTEWIRIPYGGFWKNTEYISDSKRNLNGLVKECIKGD